MSVNAVSDVDLYGISKWGSGYFSINPEGNLTVGLDSTKKGVTLQSIVNHAIESGIELPVLLRFVDLLHDRVHLIHQAFAQAKEELNYQGCYQLVYPIKTNPQPQVIKAILNSSYDVGLEAGSKPELMAVMGMLEKPATIICNGYKDKEYLRLALIAQQMGHNVIIVIEKPSELDLLLKEALVSKSEPRIGVRIRLASKSAGKWEHTSGAKSKFGLNAAQVLALVQKLKSQHALHWLTLMHCHLGSQVANILDIRSCMLEVARYYIELRELGVPIALIDVGGGLGIDYEGTYSTNDCSINYNLKEYALNVLLPIHDLCIENNIPEPNLISESGRAVSAHHAVLITNITTTEEQDSHLADNPPDSTASRVILDIWDTYQSIPNNPPKEMLNYATHALHEAHALFKHGVISLSEKAQVERLFHKICMKLRESISSGAMMDEDIKLSIQESLANKLFCNLSFFKSLPDAWAIEQIFPILPLTHLEKNTNIHSTLQDLTCDSDGKLKRYTHDQGISTTLPLPFYDKTHPYLLGFFLVGAYQEILGSSHNLFGNTPCLDIQLIGNERFEITQITQGHSMSDVLSICGFDIEQLQRTYSNQLNQSHLSKQQIALFTKELQRHFSASTYLLTATKEEA